MVGQRIQLVFDAGSKDTYPSVWVAMANKQFPVLH